MVAPKARKGPKGTRAPVLSRARKIPARAATQPMIERRAEREENRLPSEERADGGDQLDVTEAHGFARDDDCAQRSGDLFEISQRRFLVGKDHPVVAEPKDRRRSGDAGARAFEHEFIGFPGEDILPGQCLIADRERGSVSVRQQSKRFLFLKAVALAPERKFAELDDEPEKAIPEGSREQPSSQRPQTGRSFASTGERECSRAAPPPFRPR